MAKQIFNGEKGFKQKVLEVVSYIPAGSVMSYKEVARRAGNKKAARAVGNILNKNHDKNIPCHRVARADGKIGGYNRGVSQKKKLLQSEAKELNNPAVQPQDYKEVK